MAILMALTGCAPGPALRAWTEDVLLEEGLTLQVKREVRFQETNSLSGDAFNTIIERSTLSFSDGGRVLPQWNVPLMPMVLYRDAANDEWVIVALTMRCETWVERGRPRPPYWEYRLRGATWEAVPLSPSSIGRPANLLLGYETGLSTHHVTTTDKARLNAGAVPVAAQVLGKADNFCRNYSG